MHRIAALLLAMSPVIDVLPVPSARIVNTFQAPTSTFGAGHRGIDLEARPGALVASPVAGVVTFAGRVGGKDVVAVQDGARLVSLEPVVGTVPVGTRVTAGSRLGIVGVGGHCSLTCVHLGLRVDGVYVPPVRHHARLVP